MANILVSCSSCKQEYELANTVKKLQCLQMEKQEEVSKAKKLLLTYSVCPFCGHVHLSQLDDDITKAMQKELVRLLKKKALFDSKGRQMKRKDARRVVELNKSLNALRLSLKETYQRKTMLKLYDTQSSEIPKVFVFEYSEPKLVLNDKENVN